ncbi:MAG: DUF4013 domain-containing protein [Candidatus Aquicultorales bacterium]
MDFNKAFTYMFNDPEWVKKVAIFVGLAVASIFIIPAFFISGYFAATIKRVADGEEGLPEWENWGELFSIGLKTTVVGLILSLPMIIIMGIFMGSAIAAALSGGSDVAGAVLGGGAFFGVLLAMLYGLAMAAIGPAMMLQFIKEGYNIGAAFKFGEVFQIITADVGSYVLAVIVTAGLFMAGGIVGQIIPFLGMLIVMPFEYEISAHLFGQLLASRSVSVQTADHPV